MLFLSILISGLLASGVVAVPHRLARASALNRRTSYPRDADLDWMLDEASFISQDLTSEFEVITAADRRTKSRPSSEDLTGRLAGAFAIAQAEIEYLPAHPLPSDLSLSEHYAPLVTATSRSFLALMELVMSARSARRSPYFANVSATSHEGVRSYIEAVDDRFPGFRCALKESLLGGDTPAGLALERVSVSLFQYVTQGECPTGQ